MKSTRKWFVWTSAKSATGCSSGSAQTMGSTSSACRSATTTPTRESVCTPARQGLSSRRRTETLVWTSASQRYSGRPREAITRTAIAWRPRTTTFSSLLKTSRSTGRPRSTCTAWTSAINSCMTRCAWTSARAPHLLSGMERSASPPA